MRVSIYGETPKENVFQLKLFRAVGRVIVALVDENGEKINSSSLVAITDDMKLVRCKRIDASIGLPLDTNQQLTEDVEN